MVSGTIEEGGGSAALSRRVTHAGSRRLGNRRPERSSRQTWTEAHYADPQDAEVGDLPAWSPKRPWGKAL